METVTDISQLSETSLYSYADYLTWRFGEIVEVIKGKMLKMSPAPLRKHQLIVLNVASLFNAHLKNTGCSVYVAPFDVRFPRKNAASDDRQIFTVVQPDICVVCDESKLDDRGCIGAPDLIIEVLSPGNTGRDTKIKFDLYEEFGVPEYWIVFGGEKSIVVYLLEGGEYQLHAEYDQPGLIPVHAVPGFSIEWAEIFTAI